MGERTSKGGHFCAGCELNRFPHVVCSQLGQKQTAEELKTQGLKRVRGKDGKERTIEIPHSIIQTLFYGTIGLLYRPKLVTHTSLNGHEPVKDVQDFNVPDPLTPVIHYPVLGVTRTVLQYPNPSRITK